MQESKPETDDQEKALYAVLAETNNQYCETWYYLIRYDKNVDALEYLYKQLDSIDWIYLENYSSFSLDLINLVSSQTAKELTKISINDGSKHRKFDGDLQFINFRFRNKDHNILKLIKVCELIANGNIDQFIDNEDYDSNLREDDDSEDDSDSTSSEDSDDCSDEDSDDRSDENSDDVQNDGEDSDNVQNDGEEDKNN